MRPKNQKVIRVILFLIFMPHFFFNEIQLRKLNSYKKYLTNKFEFFDSGFDS